MTRTIEVLNVDMTTTVCLQELPSVAMWRRQANFSCTEFQFLP